MREIKFRGKHENPYEDKWVYGYYALQDGRHVIIMPHLDSYEKSLKEGEPIPTISVSHNIDINTIGQYTGLHDKNGIEIYEGDIVEINYKGKDIGKVIYEHNSFTVDVTNMNKPYGRCDLLNRFMEVIGNVWEDSDLLNDSKNTKNY